MNIVPRFIRAWFAWRHVFAAGCWLYEVNEITGKRRARSLSGGYSPLAWEWLLSGRGMPNIDGIPAWRSRYRDTLSEDMIGV